MRTLLELTLSLHSYPPGHLHPSSPFSPWGQGHTRHAGQRPSSHPGHFGQQNTLPWAPGPKKAKVRGCDWRVRGHLAELAARLSSGPPPCGHLTPSACTADTRGSQAAGTA